MVSFETINVDRRSSRSRANDPCRIRCHPRSRHDGERHERAAQSRHAVDAVRKPDGRRWLRIRRIRRAASRALLHELFRKHGFHRGRAAQDACDHDVSPGRRATSWSTRIRIPSPPTSPPSTVPAPAVSRSASASPPNGCAATALGNGGEADRPTRNRSKAVDAPVIKGIGDCMLYLVDRYGAKGRSLRRRLRLAARCRAAIRRVSV